MKPESRRAPPPTATRAPVVIDGIKFLALAALLTLGLLRAAEGLGYHWQWYRVSRFLMTAADGSWAAGPLLQGLFITFRITAAGLLLTALLGLSAALMRLSGSLVARFLARAYVELIRNTPLLVQLFLIYFVLAPVFGLDAFAAAVLALGLFEGAYAAEIIRAGILSIHRGQWEAAFSIGLGAWRTYRLVILPQALRIVLPPLTGQAVSLVKDSALVSTIAIYDLTMQGQAIISETYLVFEVWFTVAALYLAVTLALSFAAARMERRFRYAL